MANFHSIQRHIDRGRGIAAKHLGEPFSVYRIGPGAAGDMLQAGNLVYTNFPMFRRVIKSDPGMETEARMGTLWYNLIGDLTNLITGDVMIQTDAFYGPGATQVNFPTLELNGICVASHAPVKKSFGARINRLAQIYRPAKTPATNNPNGAYWKSTLDNAQPLICTYGMWQLGAAGLPASLIPVGLMAYYRPYGPDWFHPGVPGMPKPTLWFIYVPPTQNFHFAEGDRLVLQDGSRYVIYHPYEQETGMVGSQLVCEREISDTIA